MLADDLSRKGRFVERGQPPRRIVRLLAGSGAPREVPLGDEVLSPLKQSDTCVVRWSSVRRTGGCGTRAMQASALACVQARRASPERWHALRHTFTSQFVMRGAAMKAVQELLGHATMEMSNRYSYLSTEVPRHAVKLLDGLDRVSNSSGRTAGRQGPS
jgi:integrase